MNKDEMREAIVTLRATWPKARWSAAQVRSMEIICDLLESLVDDLGSASVIREERDSDPDVRDLPGGKVQVVNPLPIIDEGEAIEALLNNFEIDDGIEESAFDG